MNLKCGWCRQLALRTNARAVGRFFSGPADFGSEGTLATIERNQPRKGQAGPGKAQESSLERQLPRNLEAERAVLGSILLLPEVFAEVALVIRGQDFYDDANRILYEHLLQMHDGGQQIDLMLLVERLRTADQYDSIGGAAYLAEVGQQVPTAAHAVYYAGIVADKSVLRSLIHAGTDILHDAYDPTADTRDMLSKAEEKVFGILESRGSGEV